MALHKELQLRQQGGDGGGDGGGGDCDEGYSWYTCTFGDNNYAGCCKVDPCSQPKSAHCPASAQPPSTAAATTGPAQPTTTTMLTTTSNDSNTSQSSTSADPATLTGAASSQGTGDASSSSSPSSPGLPVGALVGIVLGCVLLSALLGIWLCMRWGRRRSEKKAETDTAAGQGQGHGHAKDENPSPNPSLMPATGSHDGGNEALLADEKTRASCAAADFADGHLSTRHHFGGQPLGVGSRPQSSQVSPLTADSVQPPPWRHSELASNPVHELDCTSKCSPVELDPQDDTAASSSSAQHGASALDVPPTAESWTQLRATLNATQHERASNTYSNSWSKYYNVQV